MNVILVRGVGNSDEGNLDRMAAELTYRGLTVKQLRYHPVNWLSAIWRRKKIARMLLNLADDGDAIVAHSFGCAVVHKAMTMGGEFGPVVFFSAALDADVYFPRKGMTKLLNVRHAYDKALTVGSLLPWHFFGLLGRDGYMGYADDRITGEVSTAKVGEHWHTAPFFAIEHVGYWADRVERFIRGTT